MAGLISTGIAGFLSSAKFTGKQILNKAGKLVPEVVSTFISGATGWIIKNNGDAEFKSIYARDKFITNEYVYNRIRVTEDEEIISSSMKILSAINNENGTWTVYPDLREGDVNPLANGDLLQGYYHALGSTGTVYAIQRFTATSNPGTEDQSITIVCEKDCIPYQHMIIVRVGNTTNVDRQSFIRICSRTNCQYFYDEIASFADLDNPDKVKCAIGKADPGLIPEWAVKAIGNVKKWFGLIADGVILRGTFILQSSNKTVESELEGVNTTITDIETRFEVKEGQISASVKTAESYAKTAVDNANFAGEAANAAHGALTGVKESEAIILLTSKGIESKVSEIRKEVDNATGVLQDISEKESSINHTADGINTKVSEVKIYSESAAASANAAADSATAAESAKTISVEKSAEAKQTADGFQNTVTEVTKKAVADAVAGSDAVIEEKVSTQVTQSAKEWKVEVMGSDAQGNPNSVIAAINATPEGIEIEGKKVKITGELLAEIIKASGLNINDKFVVGKDGKMIASEGSRIGNLTITDKGSLYGAVTTFDKCSVGAFSLSQSVNINENTYINHVIEHIGSVSTYILLVQVWVGTYNINLPNYNDLIENAFEEIGGGIGFLLRFIVPPKWDNPFLGLLPNEGVKSNDAIFRIRAKSDSPIYNNNGGNESYVELTKGDVLELYCYIRTERIEGSLNVKYYAEYYIKSK